MAEAKEITQVQTEVVGYELELTPNEAQFLADVMSRIAGQGESRRRFADSISRALGSVGVYMAEVETDIDKTYRGVGIMFLNPDEPEPVNGCGCW